MSATISITMKSIILMLYALDFLEYVHGFVGPTAFNYNSLAHVSRHGVDTRQDSMVCQATSVSDINRALDDTKSKDRLPIFDTLDQVQSSLLDVPNLLLEAPPGAGKTSIIPLAIATMMMNRNMHRHAKEENDNDNTALRNNVWVVEPRRVAARSAALRMAAIIDEPAGGTIGYAVRGDARISRETRITVVTEGVVLNRLQQDPSLENIDAVIFDEFHERGVGADTALALCLEVQDSIRPDLNIVVMSATLFAGNGGERGLENALGGSQKCRIVKSEGRIYPIDIQWAKTGYQPLSVLLKSRDDLVKTMCDAIVDALHIAPAKGDILAFLPGAREIERVVQELGDRRADAEILPLYGSMPKQKQDYAIFPSSTSGRRVIVSSPIAEASLTIEGVTCVVDSGLRREARCDADTGMPRLVTTRCSKASSRQRAGRAGRLQPGLCLRLFSESEFEARFAEHSPPEILSTDLVPTLLLLSEWGCSEAKDVAKIPFVDQPPVASIEKAYETLEFLEAVEEIHDGRYKLTELGRSIAMLPIHPRLATCIYKAENKNSLAAATVASAILDDDIGLRWDGDACLVAKVRAVLKDNNRSTVSNVLQFAGRVGKKSKEAVTYFIENPIDNRGLFRSIGPGLLPGFIDLVAERKGDASYGGSTYMLSLGRSARLDGIKDSPQYIVVAETTTGDDNIARIRSFAPIDIEDLRHVAKDKDVVFTVPSRGHEVRARRSLMVGALELSSSPLPSPSAPLVTEVLLNTIRSLGGVTSLLRSLSKDRKNAVDQLRARVRLAASLGSSEEWPVCFSALDACDSGNESESDTAILESLIEPWLAPAGSLKGVNIYQVLQGSLTVAQQSILDDSFPERIVAPDGTQIPIRYTGEGPFASAKLQQFFGTAKSPRVGFGSLNSIPVTLSLLSPAGKELARTVDLPFFWKEVYPNVRAEMRGRYSKHPWPEDPSSAAPTRQTNKQLSKSNGEDTPKQTKKRSKPTRRNRR